MLGYSTANRFSSQADDTTRKLFWISAQSEARRADECFMALHPLHLSKQDMCNVWFASYHSHSWLVSHIENFLLLHKGSDS